MSEPSNTHPFIDFIFSLVEVDPKYRNMGFPDLEVLYFSEESKRKIEKEFERYFDSSDLKDIVVDLLKLGTTLDEQGHKDAGLFIIILLTNATESLEEQARRINPNFGENDP